MLTSQIETLTKEKNELGIFEKSMDLEELENINKQELSVLENEINDISKDLMDTDPNKYKSIPIYNSCTAEANGDTTEIGTKPNNDKTQTQAEIDAERQKTTEHHKKLLEITKLTELLKDKIGKTIHLNMNDNVAVDD